jgi:hypothetical protein
VPETQSLDESLVAVEIPTLQIVQELSPLPDHHEKTPTGMEILLVRLQVLRQTANPMSQDRDLNLRRPRVGAVHLEFLNDFLLLFTLDHCDTPFRANPEPQNGVRIPDPSAGSKDILSSRESFCKKDRLFPLDKLFFM